MPIADQVNEMKISFIKVFFLGNSYTFFLLLSEHENNQFASSNSIAGGENTHCMVTRTGPLQSRSEMESARSEEPINIHLG